MVWHKRTIHMYAIPDSELRELTSGYNSLHLVLFGVCIGAFISLFTAYKTANIDTSTKPYFIAAILVSVGLAVWCGIGTMHHYRASKSRIADLHKEDVVVNVPK
jgi:hypothetical protein